MSDQTLEPQVVRPPCLLVAVGAPGRAPEPFVTFDRDGRPCLVLPSVNHRYALDVQDGGVGVCVMHADGNVLVDLSAGADRKVGK